MTQHVWREARSGSERHAAGLRGAQLAWEAHSWAERRTAGLKGAQRA